MDNFILNVFFIILSVLLGTVSIFFSQGNFHPSIRPWIVGFFSLIAAVLCTLFPFVFFSNRWDFHLVPLAVGVLYGEYTGGFFVIGTAGALWYVTDGLHWWPLIATVAPLLMLVVNFGNRLGSLTCVKRVVIAVAADAVMAVLLSTKILPTGALLTHPITKSFVIYLLAQMICTCVSVCLIETLYRNLLLFRRLHQLDNMRVASELAASIAHEVRNPLTVCKGFLQLLNESLSDETHHRYVQTILAEIDRAGSVIDDYLSFSHPEINRETVADVATSAQQSTRTLHSFASLNNVTIATDFHKDLYARVDEEKLKQALVNIMKNGIEAMPSGGVLQVVTRRQGEHAMISVIDNGVGMTDEEVQRLGQPFYSVKHKGTGFGLMTSFQYIRLMNGEIHVKSAKGRGTQVYVQIPLLCHSVPSTLNCIASAILKWLQIPPFRS